MFHIALNTKDGFKINNSPDFTSFNLTNFPPDQMIEIQLVSAIIPNLRYAINDATNTLAIIGTLFTGTMTLTNGNYDYTTFAAALQAALRTATSSTTLTVTYDTLTSYVTIATGDVTTIGFSSSSTMLKVLGFSTSGVTAATSIVSSYPVRLDGTTYVDVVMSPIAAKAYQATTAYSTRNIIARIMMNANFGEIMYYEPFHPISVQGRSSNLSSLTVTLIDDQDQAYTLPYSADCAFLLQCKALSISPYNVTNSTEEVVHQRRQDPSEGIEQSTKRPRS